MERIEVSCLNKVLCSLGKDINYFFLYGDKFELQMMNAVEIRGKSKLSLLDTTIDWWTTMNQNGQAAFKICLHTL